MTWTVLSVFTYKKWVLLSIPISHLLPLDLAPGANFVPKASGWFFSLRLSSLMITNRVTTLSFFKGCFTGCFSQPASLQSHYIQDSSRHIPFSFCPSSYQTCFSLFHNEIFAPISKSPLPKPLYILFLLPFPHTSYCNSLFSNTTHNPLPLGILSWLTSSNSSIVHWS